MKRYLPAGAAALAIVAIWVGLAWAQITGLVPGQFSGLEVFVAQVSGPGSESVYVTSGMLRNTTGGITQTATTGTNTWPTTAPGGVTVGPSVGNYSRLCFTGAVGTMTQNLPAAPFDGQTVELINCQGTTWTALTVAQTDGSTLVNFGAALALAAGVSAEFYYLKSTNSWYRIR